MAVRHPASVPPLWLMTDERQGDALWPALAALPRGSGIVFRHRQTEARLREALYARIDRIARRRGLVLLREDAPEVAIMRIHSIREALAAQRGGAAMVFVSPVFATRSHPGAPALGPLRAAVVARAARLPAIALGGMDARRFRRMRRLGFAGWAAIDALTPAGQKRKAVPT